MRTTRFDLVTSFFSASIWMLVTMVIILLLLWLVDSVSRPTPMNPPTASVSTASLATGEREFEIPASEELVDLTPPSLNEVLLEVNEAASEVAAGLPNGALTPGDGAPVTGIPVHDHAVDPTQVQHPIRWRESSREISGGC